MLEDLLSAEEDRQLKTLAFTQLNLLSKFLQHFNIKKKKMLGKVHYLYTINTEFKITKSLHVTQRGRR